MIVCLDVDYRDNIALAAAIVFEKWNSDAIIESHCIKVDNISPYISGEFYKRELPCLLSVLDKIKSKVDLIIVDSYVFLAEDVPGMGFHLFEALNYKIPIIGCAKTYFKTDNLSVPVFRGTSKSPLYITSVDIDKFVSANYIISMHGLNRIPTLLKQVDRLCRDGW